MTDLEIPVAGPGTTTSLTIIEPATGLPVPAMIAGAGERASLRFIDFFTAHIRNPNTRAAYGVAVRGFFTWLETQALTELAEIRTHHVSTYTEILTRNYSAPDRQAAPGGDPPAVRLAHRRPGDRSKSCIAGARAHACRQKSKTPVLLADEARQLIDSIDVSTIIGLRDRALIALLVYSFARISAALQMDVEDYYPQGKRWWVRQHEKGGKQHEMPAHHLLEEYLDAYVTAAGIGAEKNTPLFRTLGGRCRKQLTADRMTRQDARRMIVRRARNAGLLTRLGCHSFRAIGITVYLLNGGLLEYAQQMAAHESARTTKLYDRRNDQVTLDQVERIVL